ncbi:hypothetical protein PFISCL1PPCAC_3572, partial [Pristionchus fissidentatus]
DILCCAQHDVVVLGAHDAALRALLPRVFRIGNLRDSAALLAIVLFHLRLAIRTRTLLGLLLTGARAPLVVRVLARLYPSGLLPSTARLRLLHSTVRGLPLDSASPRSAVITSSQVFLLLFRVVVIL